MLVALILFAIASVFVYSLPGLVWFAIAVPIWLALELGTARLRIDVDELRAEARRHRRVISPWRWSWSRWGRFRRPALRARRQGRQVQQSGGPAELAGLPRRGPGDLAGGDFQVVRGEVSGAYLAVARGLLAAAIGGLAAIRRRDFGPPGGGARGGVVYAGLAAVRVDLRGGKALPVLAPLVVLAGWRLCLPRGARRRPSTARFALGAMVAVALAGSTLLALRAAPVGFGPRGDELELLAGLVRGARCPSCGGPVRRLLASRHADAKPRRLRAGGSRGRPKKVWQLGLGMDLDTLEPWRLDHFDYPISTRAAFQSTSPPNFETVVTRLPTCSGGARGRRPRLPVIDKNGTPGRVLDCASALGRRLARRPGSPTVITEPVTGGPGAWSRGSPFDAPAIASPTLDLGPRRWRLSLQYHRQAPLTVWGSRLERRARSVPRRDVPDGSGPGSVLAGG